MKPRGITRKKSDISLSPPPRPNIKDYQQEHYRSPTMIVNDVNQSYQFISAISTPIFDSSFMQTQKYRSEDSMSEQDMKGKLLTNSIFASTAETKSPLPLSAPRKRRAKKMQLSISTDPSMQVSLKAYRCKVVDGNQEDWFVQNLQNRGAIGYIPSKMYCLPCKQYVSTEVKIEQLKMSFWDRLCCRMCYGNQNRYHVIKHRCRYCHGTLAKIDGRDIM